MTNKNQTVLFNLTENIIQKRYRFISCLMRLEAQQQAQKAKTKKEQQRIENEFMDFGSKVTKRVLNNYFINSQLI